MDAERSDMRPWPGLLRAPYRSIRNYYQDDGPLWAAALAFYAILSVVPLVIVASAALSLFVSTAWAADQASKTIQALLPVGAPEVQRIIEDAVSLRARASFVSLLLLLWAGSRVFGVLIHAMNLAFVVDETYSLTRRIGLQIAMAATLGTAFVLALLSRTLLSFALLDEGTDPARVIRLTLWVVPSLLIFLCFYVTYRFVPRRSVARPAAFAGAAVAFVLFAGARQVFLYALTWLGDYNVIYGSLAILILLLIWVWFAAQVALLGGQVASYVQGVFVEGITPEAMQERHIRTNPFHKPPSDTLNTVANGVRRGVQAVKARELKH